MNISSTKSSNASSGRSSLAGWVIAIALAVVLANHWLPVLPLVENFLKDVRLVYLGHPMEQSSDVVIVGIDEETLSNFSYRSPIDRAFIATLLTSLEEKGVASIGLDILFDQPTEPHKDKLLSQSLAQLTIPVVLAKPDSDAGLSDAQVAYLKDFTAGQLTGDPSVLRDKLDGIVRSAPLVSSTDSPERRSFSAEIARANDVALPVESRIVIDFQRHRDRDQRRFAVYPAHTISYLPDEWLRGKVALIGADLSLEDKHATPLNRLLPGSLHSPGVEIHAQVLQQLIDGRRIVQIPWLANLALVVCMAAVGFLLATINTSTGRRVLACGIALLVYWVVVVVIYAVENLMLEAVTVSLALILASGVSLYREWRAETQRKVFIQQAFSHYLSPQFVDQLVENPELLVVGGEQRELTFLFTDLADFTPLTESLQPGQLVNLINTYLDATCEIATRHGGMVAGIVGDALFVMFNAPLFQHDHASRAVRAALELDDYCEKFRRQQCEAGITLGVTRIGINTGSAILGNYGGSHRLEYTALGDSINTASRLEGVNKYIGTRICVSEATVNQCPDIQFRPIGKFVLKGKTESIMTFEPQKPDETASTGLRGYEEAYARLASNERDCEAMFTALNQSFPNDPLVAYHMRRLAQGESGDTIVMSEK
ncbi:MAG: adenylate/guanylate cyclase domain-containing protein [Pseudomonadota bacterium]